MKEDLRGVEEDGGSCLRPKFAVSLVLGRKKGLVGRLVVEAEEKS